MISLFLSFSKDTLSGDTKVVLVNAIYFKGTWKIQFDPELTTRRKFFYNSNNTEEYEMMDYMETEGLFSFGDVKELEAQAVAIPYKVNSIFIDKSSIYGIIFFWGLKFCS